MSDTKATTPGIFELLDQYGVRVSSEDIPLLLQKIREQDKTLTKQLLKQLGKEINNQSPAKHAERIVNLTKCVVVPKTRLLTYDMGKYTRSEFDLDIAVAKLMHETKEYGKETTDMMPISKKNKIAKEVAIRAATSVHDINKNHGYINTLSGMIHAESGGVSGHDPRYLSTTQLPVRYEPAATCPLFDKHLEKFCANADGTRNMRHENLIWQMVALSIYPHTGMQVSWGLYGEGDNGKGTIFHVIGMLVGEHQSAVTLKEILEGDSFIFFDMVDKLINIDGDVDTPNDADFGKFKKLTGGDPVRINGKYEQPYAAVIPITLLLAFNKIPRYQLSYAVARRIQLIPVYGKVPKRERQLQYHRTFEPEMPGILNKALVWLRKIIRTNKIEGAYSPESVIMMLSDKSGDIVTHAAYSLFESDNYATITMSDIKTAIQQFIKLAELGLSDDAITKLTNPTKLGRIDMIRHAKVDGRPIKYKLRYKDIEQQPQQRIDGS